MSAQEDSTQKTNALIHSTSPYLLQHAYNPVDWYPWGDEALAKAKAEDKPIILSIGYSACHWCHVMEKESFEDAEVAEIMNKYFISIKVDREERPDVDGIYMDAVQAMGVRGGWPLNAFLLPNTQPFYAGTYFPQSNWKNLLLKIAEVYDKNRKDLEESAQQLTEAISKSELEKYGLAKGSSTFELSVLEEAFRELATSFDLKRGGMAKAPKFPMPSIYNFLLNFSELDSSPTLKKQAQDQVLRSLDEMAAGGIYDQIGGGFARYSVDADWFAPHFEKMLYDNAQLLSLYARAYQIEPKASYKKVVYQTIEFLEREMLNKEGGFYSALDADSEGIEGKFYVWEWFEIEQLFPEEKERALLADYYQLKKGGNWEHNYNILHRKGTEEDFAKEHGLSLKELKVKVENWSKVLMKARDQKIRPGLDDKTLCAWNALMIQGLVKAYEVFGEESFLGLAEGNAAFILDKFQQDSGALFRTYKNGQSHLSGYLEDYAQSIKAFIDLYQITFKESYLEQARVWMDYTLENFYDSEEGFFFYTDAQSEALITRKKEIFDNVIPASNSVMGHNLFYLGIILSEDQYREKSQSMLSTLPELISQNVEYLTHWASLYSLFVRDIAEVVLVGDKALEYRRELGQKGDNPYQVFLGFEKESSLNLALFEGRNPKVGETSIYVCFQGTCKLPVKEVEAAWKLILEE